MMKRAIALLQIVSILFWNMPLPALADDSDIFGSNIAPNVMLLIDSSDSMNDSIFSHPYVAATTYNTPLTYNTTKVYRRFTSSSSCSPQPAPCYKVYKNSVAEVPDADSPASPNAARDALHKVPAGSTTVGYWTGKISGSTVNLFYGNYLNYLACTTCSIMEPKIVIAKRILTNLVNNTEGVRFGAMKFKANGGLVMEPIRDMTSTNKATLIATINSMTTPGGVGTPTGDQIHDAGQYYKGLYTGYSSPIQLACQPNFVIVVSDGLQTQSNKDAPVAATERFTQDHRNDLSNPDLQNVIVHTVGFGLPAGDVNAGGLTKLEQTATNGGGSFYTADSSAQLEVALQDAISQIIAATFSFATPVIPTTGTSGSTKAYLASFQSNASRPFWKGFLKAYNRDSNGLIPVDAQGIPTGTPAWDAGELLSAKSASSRNIYTVVSGSRQLFNNTNVTSTLLGVDNPPFPLGATSASQARDNVIDFIRGAVDFNDEDADNNKTEERPWKLGDIFHSTPVLVTPPFLPSGDSTYNTFKTTNASRTTVLLAGANDGMLHAFRESDGEELWAFIPPDLLDNLKDLTALSADHSYYVDSSPIAADVKISGNWKTIVVFAERRGGKSYSALDISDNTKITADPQYLWSFTDSKMGETWSEPAIGKIKKSDGSDIFVAFVGGGYDTPQNNNSGKAFFVIDLSNGAKLWEYYNNSSSDDRQYMNFSLAAAPTAVDLNNDGYIDRVYIGDVGGQLWKFDVSTPATLSGTVITNWDPAQKGKRLFAAAPSQANPPATGEYYPTQAIYVPPTLAYDTAGNLWVFFGTGDRNHPNNISTNRFYGIKENTNMTNGSHLTESSLTNLSSGTGTVSQGWYLVFSPANSGEKVLAAADVFNKIVFFTSFTPVTTAGCGTGGGDAKLYAVNMTSGDGALNLSTGETLAAGQSALATAKAIGTGIPSRPVVILTQSGNTANPYVITGTTNQQISSTQAPPVPIRRIAAWREVF